MSSDAMVFDIFFVRFPDAGSDQAARLWQEVDEQHFPSDLRRRLSEHGFRAGLIAGQIPPVLSELMQLADKPAPSVEENGTVLDDVSCDPQVVRRHLQVRAGCRSEIVASGVHERIDLLLPEPNGVAGKTYEKAQGVFSITAFRAPGERVRVEIEPELHFGESRQRYTASQGMLRLEAGRPRRCFDDLTLTAGFSPGHMLVLGSIPERRATLGQHFLGHEFQDGDPGKLLIIRLAQVQHNDLFDDAVVAVSP